MKQLFAEMPDGQIIAVYATSSNLIPNWTMDRWQREHWATFNHTPTFSSAAIFFKTPDTYFSKGETISIWWEDIKE